MTKLKELSLFLPAYNEEGNIAETIEKCDQVMRNVAEKYEILVVEDGSKDKTAEVVERLLKKFPSLRMIQHKPNRGYGGALKTGFH
jgi:dolichol-phosphate mannosyltransferase